MSTTAGPSANRGDITLQPSYFTSSLYVEPLREDISNLIDLYVHCYTERGPSQPFVLFKQLWKEQGWCWLHLKVLDARARESFIGVTERLFIERLNEEEPPIGRVVVLFSLYTFFLTQPTTSSPRIYCMDHIAMPFDVYRSLLSLPSTLMIPELLSLRPYVGHVLDALEGAKVFHILPHSGLRPYKPSVLPREIFVSEEQEAVIFAASATDVVSSGPGGGIPKRKGRPSRRDKQKKAGDALVSLEKYIDNNATTVLPGTSAVAASGVMVEQPRMVHRMAVHPPATTREEYRAQKGAAMDVLKHWSGEITSHGGPTWGVHAGRQALARANEAVLARLKMIDEIAAEQGLEVGGEGGEKTGLARVERAVQQLVSSETGSNDVGIMGLLEGAGLDANWDI